MIRRIHPDFHIPERIAGVAGSFDGERFAHSLLDASVDSVVLFAKCMYGFAYWRATVGKRHPGLGERDFLAEAVEACRQHDIETLAYYFPFADQSLCHTDTEHAWKQRAPDGSPYWAMCPNTEYTERIVLRQLAEIASRYPIDGFHVDGTIIRNGGCWCSTCREKMAREGVDAADPAAIAEFSRRSVQCVIRRMTETVRAQRQDLVLSYNNLVKLGCRDQVQYSDVVDLELNLAEIDRLLVSELRASLFARHIRTLGKAFAITSCCRARGIAAYGSLSTLERLKSIASIALSLGGYCQFINEMLPEGVLEKPVVDRIGEAYAFVRERERWCIGARAVRYAAVFGPKDRGTGGSTVDHGADSPILGAVRLLRESHAVFDVLDEEADVSPYRVVVVPDVRIVDPEAQRRLERFVRSGGRLFISGPEAVNEARGSPLLETLGVRFDGMGGELAYLRLGREAGSGLPEMVRRVVGAWACVTPEPGVERLAEIVRPRRDNDGQRIGWGFPPESRDSGWPGLVLRRLDAGLVLYAPVPLFDDYAKAPDEEQRRFLDNVWRIVSPETDRPVVVPGLPKEAEVSLMEKDGAWILHIVRAGETAPPALHGLSCTLAPPFRPRRVYEAPTGRSIRHRMESGRVHLDLPEVAGHTMIVLEPPR